MNRGTKRAVAPWTASALALSLGLSMVGAGGACGREDFDDAASRYCRDGTDEPCTVADAGGRTDAGTDAGNHPGDAGVDAGAPKPDAGAADAGPDGGGCPSACEGGQVCSNGACVCPGDHPDLCGGVCTDLQADGDHCGACETSCGPPSFCAQGQCALPTDAGPYNFAFVTSGTVVPGALGALSAADAFCQASAADAGLPGTYRALLATAGSDPWQRLAASRGWVRRDLKPARDQIEVAGRREMFHPLRVDEHGVDVGEVKVATGIPAGSTPSTCLNWTDADAGTYTVGNSAMGGSAATAGGYPPEPCGAAAHLYCFGVGKNAALVLPAPAGRRVFLMRSSQAIRGGLNAADAYCNADALDAGLSPDFLAVLATSTAPAGARFDAGTWYLPNGLAIDGFLTDAGPDAPINVHATGAYDVNALLVATGSTSPELPGRNDCGEWTGDAGLADVGSAAHSGPKSFFSLSFPACNAQATLYCAEP